MGAQQGKEKEARQSSSKSKGKIKEPRVSQGNIFTELSDDWTGQVCLAVPFPHGIDSMIAQTSTLHTELRTDLDLEYIRNRMIHHAGITLVATKDLLPTPISRRV